MIIKILPSSGNDFHGVQYNDKKVENGKGELMLMKNFPSFINEESSKEQVRDYFKSISNNKRVKNPQFHTVISTKFQEHSKEELTKVAENFMNDLGYGEQPFIAVFHKDTVNNHIHIVSTRVSKETGKKIKAITVPAISKITVLLDFPTIERYNGNATFPPSTTVSK